MSLALQEKPSLHGVCVFLPSLWSYHSCGVGELYDLLPLIEWASLVGLSVLQLLPIYDTAEDPSPYFLHSAYALNPLYLSLHALPGVKEAPILAQGLARFKKTWTPRVDYRTIRRNKLAWLKNYFSYYSEQFLSDPQLALFIEQQPWVKGYALYQLYKKKFRTDNWQEWPMEYRNWSSKDVEKCFAEQFSSVVFYVFVQFYLHQQLEEVSYHARRHNVLLKGDIPFGVSSNSADVWLQPHLFCLDYVLGCEPDPIFNSHGQKWGMPLYCWDQMEKDGLQWWRARIETGSRYFDLIRLDHVAGFFRAWGVPREGRPLEGRYFSRSENMFLAGVDLLQKIIQGHQAIFVGEDLGKGVPYGLHEYLNACNVFSTNIFRWEEPRSEQSMTTLGTHDMEPLSVWWGQAQAHDKKHFAAKGAIGVPFTAEVRESVLLASHSSKSILHINLLHEYLAYFQEFSPESPGSERINVPGVVHENNWSYRIEAPVEEIVKHQGLKELFMRLLAGCNVSL